MSDPLNDWWEWYEEYLTNKTTALNIAISTPSGPPNRYEELVSNGKAKLAEQGNQDSTQTLSE